MDRQDGEVLVWNKYWVVVMNRDDDTITTQIHS